MPNRQTLSFPICPLCNEPVELETTKTNKDEELVHEECYVISLIQFDFSGNRVNQGLAGLWR